ncbi:hypothetical protein X975_24521, partial [Stegodyphus mimosarum]
MLREESLELIGPWRIIFVVFVTYSMLPLSLRWCLLCGTVSSVGHIIILVLGAPR